MRKIRIVCPICAKRTRIEVPYEIFNIDEGSLLKLPVKRGMVCEHDFLALIDYHFNIRDYEIPEDSLEFEQFCAKSVKKNIMPLFSSF